jgi:hypothetical protein
MLCRHCHRKPGNRRRGLCYRCWCRPAVRALYPEKRGWHGREDDRNGGYALPLEPTDAPPGSPEKWQVFSERVRLRVSLHHPLDAPRDPESAGFCGRSPREAGEARVLLTALRRLLDPLATYLVANPTS